ncbi:hypothetical protein BW687_006305 [Pseudomonas graminis]|uniref:hypothetical protein n=1 Tax=Pseudomonas graminis TaxID=158627 RepID=UPI00234B000B|nr:hypothetical protein [Pseudomonas graminis]MDC6379792.1 hypothetical protein [Pseudomonas graminis]
MNGKGITVIPASFDVGRSDAIRTIVYEVVAAELTGDVAQATCISKLQCSVSFGNWADKMMYCDYLVSPVTYRDALLEYTSVLRARIAAGEITKNTAASLQRAPIENIHSLFPNPGFDVAGGVSIIKTPTKAETKAGVDNTERLKDIDVLFPFHVAIFRGLSELVCQNRNFPFRLKLPSEECWVVPNKRFFALTTQQLSKISDGGWLNVWDAESGLLKDLSKFDLADQKYAFRKVVLAKAALIEANRDSQHNIRNYLAKFAHDSFLVAFVAITGMNESDIRNMPWGDHYTIARKGIGIKSVKHRAGKEVEYFITDIFENDLLLFFELRKFIVADSECQSFFVGQYAECDGSPNDKLHSSAILKHGQRVKNNFDDSVPILSYQLLREHRSIELLKKNDPETAAALSNHTVATLVRSYVNPSVAEAEYELTNYYNHVVRRVDEVRKSLTGIPAGECKKYGDPEKIDVASVEPDCKDFKGCLFCEHFVIHARRQDIVKLYSLLFVVYASTDVCDTEISYSEIYSPIISRVKALINGISSMSVKMGELCTEVEREVFTEERLTAYWAHQYDFISLVGSSL